MRFNTSLQFWGIITACESFSVLLKAQRNVRANQAALVANHQLVDGLGQLALGHGDHHLGNQEQNYNWQISKRSLRERFEFLFNNEGTFLIFD